MSDDTKRLAIEGPKALALRATFVNGSVVVESQEDRAKRRAKKKRSRWDNQGPSTSGESSSTAVVPLGTDISERKKYTYVANEEVLSNFNQILYTYLCIMCYHRLNGIPSMLVLTNLKSE